MFGIYHRNRALTAITGTILVLIGIGCELLGDDPTPGIGDVEEIAYQDHIQPIFNNRCVACHGGDRVESGLRLESWPSLIEGSDFGEAIIPFSPEQSLMIKLLTRTGAAPHPSGKRELSLDEVQLLKRWIAEGARGPTGEVPYSDSIDLIYLANEGEAAVTVIDVEAKLVVRRVDLTKHGFSGRARARHIAVEPDGSFWYVSVGSTRLSDVQAVVKFTRENQFVGQVVLDYPGQLLIHPTQDVLYASRQPSDLDTSRHLVEIRRSDMSAIQVDVTFPNAYPIAIRPQGDFVFSSSVDVDQMVIMDVDDLNVSFFDIKGVKHAFSYFTMAPWGVKMWGSAVRSGTLTLFNTSNPNRIVQHHSLRVGSDPRQLTYSPDARRVYAAVRGSDQVAVLNAVSEIIDGYIQHEGISSPVGISITQDGRYLFVSSENPDGRYQPRFSFEGELAPGTVVVIDTETLDVIKIIEVGQGSAATGSRVVLPPPVG